jgi:hypothetical protein
LEAVKKYEVEITSQAKLHYFEILEYFYEYMSYESATRKADELYNLTRSLENFPERGQVEFALQHLKKEHRYLLYPSTSKTTVKIVYFLDRKSDVVYVTDFFPSGMDDRKMKGRNA